MYCSILYLYVQINDGYADSNLKKKGFRIVRQKNEAVLDVLLRRGGQ